MVKPTIPKSLQPQMVRGMEKPPTIAERKLIQQYGSVERGRAIQAQQAQIKQVTEIPEGYLTKSDISKLQAQAQQELQQIEADRKKELEGMRARLGPGENIGKSQREEFNRKWNIIREQTNRKLIALRKLKNLVGDKIISKESLQQYVAGNIAGVERDIRRAESEAKQRALVREVTEKFGKEILKQDIKKMTLKEARVYGITPEEYKQITSEVPIEKEAEKVKSDETIKTPIGFTTKEIDKLYEEFQTKYPPMKGETAYEYTNRITSDPEYQKRYQEIIQKNTVREKMKEFAEERGYISPEQYGEIIKVQPLTETERIQLAEMAEEIRYKKTPEYVWEGIVEKTAEVAEDIGVTSAWTTIKPSIATSISTVTKGLKFYAEETPLTKVGETINLPITEKGFDIAKSIGDILKAYEVTKQSEVAGKETLEKRKNYLEKEIDNLNQATTQKEINTIINRIKKQNGINVVKITDEEGKVSYKFKIDIPKALQDKLGADTFASFYISALRKGYERTYGGITRVLGGDEVAVKTSEIVFGGIGELTGYVGVGGFLIAEPFAEKAIYGEPGELKEYVKEHPIETLILGGAVIGEGIGIIKKIKTKKIYKSYNNALEELKKIRETEKIIPPTPVGKSVSYSERYSGDLLRAQIKKLKNLNIEKRILNEAINLKFTSSVAKFQKRIPTIIKNVKGFYEIDRAGKILEFFRNQITLTFIDKGGRTVSISFVARSNRPLKNIEQFIKYGRNKQIITGLVVDEFAYLTAGRFWGGEVRDTRTFLAKEVTEEAVEEAAKTKRILEIRETKGIERFTDDFAEAFGLSPRVSQVEFKTISKEEPIKMLKRVFGTPTEEKSTIFAGTRQKIIGFQDLKPDTIVGDPFLTKLIKEQKRLKSLALKPKKIFLKLDDATKVTPKPGIPRPDVLSSTIFDTRLVHLEKVTPIKDVVAFQEAAIKGVPFVTDIKAITKAPKVTSRFGETIFGIGGIGALGTLDSERIEITTKEIDREKIGKKLISKVKMKEEEEKELIKLSPVLSPIIKPLLEPKEITREGITPISKLDLKKLQVLKQETIQIPDFIGETTPTIREFRFPDEEKIKFFPMFPPKLKKPKFIKGKRVGYNTYVKDKGKYKKVTIRPHTKEAAKDIGARITDTTTGASFKIQPIKQTKIIKGKKRTLVKKFEQEELVKGDNYFKMAANKFRNYMIKRGKKIPLQNQWIEKRGKRSDTPGEKMGLTVAQIKARRTPQIGIGLNNLISTKRRKFTI